MGLSTQTLREMIKTNIHKLVESSNQVLDMKHLAIHLEKTLQEKIQRLEADFNDLVLSGDYLESVTEGFDDLDRLLRTSHTFLDIINIKDKSKIGDHIKHYYANTLIPLLNIMSKLENDYVSIAHQTISQKQEALNKLQFPLDKLKSQAKRLRKSLFVFQKKKRSQELEQRIKFLELKRKILQLTLHHDRLNLYYFNHDHPKELRELKQKADALRNELQQFKGVEHVTAS